MCYLRKGAWKFPCSLMCYFPKSTWKFPCSLMCYLPKGTRKFPCSLMSCLAKGTWKFPCSLMCYLRKGIWKFPCSLMSYLPKGAWKFRCSLMCYLVKGMSLKVHWNFHAPVCVISLKVLLFYLPKVLGEFHVSFKNILCLHFYGFLFWLSVKNTYEWPKIKLTRSKIQDI